MKDQKHSPQWTRKQFYALQRNIAVLLRRIAIALRPQRLQRIDEPRTGIARIDDVVDIAAPRRDVRVRELRRILSDLRVRRGLRVVALVDVLAEENLHRA